MKRRLFAAAVVLFGCFLVLSTFFVMVRRTVFAQGTTPLGFNMVPGNECGSLGFYSMQSAVDNQGKVHQVVCWDPNAGAMNFPAGSFGQSYSLGANSTSYIVPFTTPAWGDLTASTTINPACNITGNKICARLVYIPVTTPLVRVQESTVTGVGGQTSTVGFFAITALVGGTAQLQNAAQYSGTLIAQATYSQQTVGFNQGTFSPAGQILQPGYYLLAQASSTTTAAVKGANPTFDPMAAASFAGGGGACTQNTTANLFPQTISGCNGGGSPNQEFLLIPF